MTVIAKVSAILDAFTADDRGVGFAELQRRTSLAKATLAALVGIDPASDGLARAPW